MGFDLNRLKASENFDEISDSAVELRSPRGNEDFRVHETWRCPGIVAVKLSGKFYVVDQDLHSILLKHTLKCELRVACSSKTGVFVWPVRVDEKVLTETADQAVNQWTRVIWQTSLKTYKVEKATEKHPDPVWNFTKIDDILDVVLTDRYLVEPTHEVVLKILAKKMRRAKK